LSLRLSASRKEAFTGSPWPLPSALGFQPRGPGRLDWVPTGNPQELKIVQGGHAAFAGQHTARGHYLLEGQAVGPGNSELSHSRLDGHSWGLSAGAYRGL
jgi:hypothetical protein